MDSFLEQMRHLGFNSRETLDMIKTALGGENNEADS